MQGRFISLEGQDGCGKSTQLQYIVALLKRIAHQEIVVTREPGGTDLGEKVRAILLHDGMHAETEALLMFAARKEHADQVIIPALRRGALVISDRFTDSSFAYQSGGRGIPHGKMLELEDWVLKGLKPDLTLLFDLPVEIGLKRLETAREPDKFEKEGSTFFEKVRNAYLRRVAEDEGRFRVINANQTIEKVWNDVERALVQFI